MARKGNRRRIALLAGALVVALLVTVALTVELPVVKIWEVIVEEDEPSVVATPTTQTSQQGSAAQPAPPIPYDFSLAPAGGGDAVAFIDLTADTRLVVYTWETDCPMCARQLPYVAKLASELDPEVARLVSISVGNSEEETIEFAAEHEFEFPVLWAYAGEKDMLYFEPGVPCLFVFEAGGELLGSVQDVEGEDFLEQVGELLK